ncbi:Holliday junction resolvase RuvX [Pseudolysinimonas yzui]|uniref:Putative pre-16S rRNA nuclease n=1 Tax=Pseudolysinimonas yzui TaxID=2708254 RepID=A0A8J3M0B7_9MICO|nr:Holliday junction resolvase RuvX [Pseudolysinimonas yzui]GHF08781.1 putative pre-16S rRNA nuclease [Pseudolysinimonas yzui]
MRTGVRLGVDVGKARVGIALCDRDGLVATPVATLAREDADKRAFRILVEEHDVTEIVIGLPLSLSGVDTASTTDAREFAAAVAHWVDVPVRLVDERLSTVSAQRALHAAGRRTKGSRPVIDQVAAVIILQNALDYERTAGRPPGVTVDPDPEG